MRAVRFHEYGGPEVLQVDEVEQPTPEDDEVLVAVRAIGVNPAETYVRSDWDEYLAPHLPMIPGSDVAGVVEAVGEAVTEFAVGDRVFAAVSSRQGGGVAEYIAIAADLCAELPDGVGFEQGAGVGSAGAIAWHAMTGKPRLLPGETCLVHGGSGGVGHIASQVAKAAGMNVIATAGSDDRVARLPEFGVDVPLNYNRDDLAEAIEEAAPEACNLILEQFPELYLDLDIQVAATDACISIFDKTEMATTKVHDGRGKNLTIWLTSAGAGHKGEAMRSFARLLESGDLEIEVARRYTFDEMPDAHRALEEEHYVGRLIVTP